MATEIKLTQGYKTIVDDEDSDLSRLKWHISPKGYAVRTVGPRKSQKNERIHRVILERKIGRKLCEHELCDHINGDQLDNRRCNLRTSLVSENSSNRKKSKNNTSGYKGVSWKFRDNRYAAKITANGKSVHLGLFKDPIEAAHAYDKAARKYHGEFARTNFKD